MMIGRYQYPDVWFVNMGRYFARTSGSTLGVEGGTRRVPREKGRTGCSCRGSQTVAFNAKHDVIQRLSGSSRTHSTAVHRERESTIDYIQVALGNLWLFLVRNF